MAKLYRTKFGSFSVKDGYCNAVYEEDGTKDTDSRFVAQPLIGVVRADDLFTKDVLPPETIQSDPNGSYRLLFGTLAAISTDVVIGMEDRPDVSLAPPPDPGEERITIISARPPPRIASFFPPSSRQDPPKT